MRARTVAYAGRIIKEIDDNGRSHYYPEIQIKHTYFKFFRLYSTTEWKRFRHTIDDTYVSYCYKNVAEKFLLYMMHEYGLI